MLHPVARDRRLRRVARPGGQPRWSVRERRWIRSTARIVSVSV